MLRKLVLGLAVTSFLALGALGQTVGPKLTGYIGRENLALIWINYLALSPEQMKSLLSLVEELLPLCDEILAMPEKLHEDLLKFKGERADLRALLSSYQKDLREKLETLEKKFVNGLKGILTVSQWEAMQKRLAQESGRPPFPRERWTFQGRETPFRIDLLRGMTLVRFLPDLKEALEAKLETLAK